MLYITTTVEDSQL